MTRGNRDIVTAINLVDYRGRTLDQLSYTEAHVRVSDDGGAFPDAVARGAEQQGRRWVQVPYDHVTRKYHRKTTATYDGQPVEVIWVYDQDTVAIWHRHDPRWAAKHGLKGSAFEGGWYGDVPAAGLSDIQVVEHDYPLPPGAGGGGTGGVTGPVTSLEPGIQQAAWWLALDLDTAASRAITVAPGVVYVSSPVRGAGAVIIDSDGATMHVPSFTRTVEEGLAAFRSGRRTPPEQLARLRADLLGKDLGSRPKLSNVDRGRDPR